MRYLDILIAITFMISGVSIAVNKDFTIKGNYTYYGDWGYFMGGIVFCYGLYILIASLKDKKCN